MAVEIEHKFLVDLDAWSNVDKPEPSLIVQSYLHSSEDLTIRARIKGVRGFLTIKGKTTGISRSEFEYEIPVEEAEEIVSSFTDKHIRKLRYEIVVGSHTWEVDVFEGKLRGLVIAEIELNSEEEKFELPNWVTQNVSADPNYYNAVLINRC